MEYRCPIHESSKYTCDRPAQYLVSGTAICSYHAAGAGLVVKTSVKEVIVTSDPACQKAEFTSRYFYDKHKSLVDKLYVILDEARQEYDEDMEVVDDFVRYIHDWANQREDNEYLRYGGSSLLDDNLL